jgi:predicted HicB family RNase H-like nuclease
VPGSDQAGTARPGEGERGVKAVSVRLEDDDHRKLRILAAQAGGSMDAYVRALLVRHLERNAPTQVEPRFKGK